MNALIKNLNGERKNGKSLHLDTFTLDEVVAQHDSQRLNWRYQNRKPLGVEDDSSQRRVYLMEDRMGCPNSSSRATVHKVDKKPTTASAENLADRDYNTMNEVRVSTSLAVDDAIIHHVSPVIDSYDIPVQDDVLKVSVEPKFENGLSLKRYLEAKAQIGQRGLSKEEFVMIGDILEAAAYLKKNGILHRDINYKNVLVAHSCRTARKLEGRLTDMTTAKQMREITDSTNPTVASQSLRDIRFRLAPNGQVYKNDEHSEMFSLGMLAVQAITGELPEFSCVKSANDYKIRLNETLASLPKWAKRHKKWIAKCLDAEVSKRHKDLDNLLGDYEEASKPNLVEKVKRLSKKSLIGIGTGLAGIALAAGLGAYELKNTQKELIEQRELAKRYNVISEWNGSPLEMKNNLVSLDVTAYRISNDWTNGYPKAKFVAVNPGDKLAYMARAIENPWPRKELTCQPSFRAITYLEGVPISAESCVRSIKNENGVISYYIDQ